MLNKRQQQVMRSMLNSEVDVIKALTKIYEQALKDTDRKILELLARNDTENLQSVIYQIKYQKQIQAELTAILKVLHDNEYTTIDDYLHDCYYNGQIGTLFDLQGQGVPLIIPIDQEEVIEAITTNSKLSAPLYTELGYNVDTLKINVTREISRGISQALSYKEIARNLSNVTKVDFNKSIRIARTEGHRIQCNAIYNTQRRAIDLGADVVKQWDSTLDGKTRPTHRALDGQIVGVNEKFKSESGYTALYPGDFGIPSEDCNCRCIPLQRATWALTDSEFAKMNNSTKELQHFENIKDYNDFKSKFWGVTNV